MLARTLLAAAFALAVLPAAAASFDCAKAAKPDEMAICNTPSLSDLDVAMATLYGVRMELPMLMGARGAAQDEQRDFLSTRAECGSDVACLTSTYNARIDVLKNTISGAMQDYCVKVGIC
jgi:uncharacterized protein